jgi:hypothetical protein
MFNVSFALVLVPTCRFRTLATELAARFATAGVPVVPLIIQPLVVLFGTPVPQFVAVLKSALPAIQEVDGLASEPHWANAGTAEKDSKARVVKTASNEAREQFLVMKAVLLSERKNPKISRIVDEYTSRALIGKANCSSLNHCLY